jgi:hypothetical protein
MAAIEAALDRQNLTLETGSLLELRFEFSESFLDGDSETYHGVMRCRALTNA